MSSNDPVIAPAYGAITEGMVLDALKQATIRQLAQARDPGAFKGNHGPNGFTCPECTGWCAEVIDDWRWTCSWCGSRSTTTTGGQSTRLHLRRLVAERYDACVRLVQAVLDPRPTPDGAVTGATVTTAQLRRSA